MVLHLGSPKGEGEKKMVMDRGQTEGEFRYVQIEEKDRLEISSTIAKKGALKDMLTIIAELQQQTNFDEKEWWNKMAVKYDLPIPHLPDGGLLVSLATGIIYRRGLVSQDELAKLEKNVMKQRRERNEEDSTRLL